MTPKLCLLATLPLACALAQPPIKSVPPAGVEIAPADRAELQAGLDRLRASTAKLSKNPLLPDVLIYQEAVRYALQYNEFFKADEVAKARVLLQHGEQRAADLAEGRAPWTTATGLVVRGYISKIDHSVQPYGLVVPPSYSPYRAPSLAARCLVSRPQRDAERSQLSGRPRNAASANSRRATPSCCNFTDGSAMPARFAGEVDFFEALDAVKRQYAIDENRILDRGFSMGGASAWHIGTHHAGLWAAVAARRRLQRDHRVSQAEAYRRQRSALVGADAVPSLRRHRITP